MSNEAFGQFFLIFQFFMSLMAAPMLAGFLAPILCLLRQWIIVPKNKEKYLNKAIEDGHIVDAVLISTRKNPHKVRFINGERRECNESQYEYIWEGQKYCYRDYNFDENVNENLRLYFQTNPSRACLAENIGKTELRFLKIYVFSMLICAIATFAMTSLLWKDQI